MGETKKVSAMSYSVGDKGLTEDKPAVKAADEPAVEEAPAEPAYTRPEGDDLNLDVRNYGAVGDGATDDTAAIQATIDLAESGDTVTIGDGNWNVGALELPEGITLVVAGRPAGALEIKAV